MIKLKKCELALFFIILSNFVLSGCLAFGRKKVNSMRINECKEKADGICKSLKTAKNKKDIKEKATDINISDGNHNPLFPEKGNEDIKKFNFSLEKGPTVLNTKGRGLFANLMVKNNEIWATYQISPSSQGAGRGSLTGLKSLYYKKFDRDLKQQQTESYAIDVTSTEYFNWGDLKNLENSIGDLGDHKLVIIDDYIYMVAILAGNEYAGLFKFDLEFNSIDYVTNVGLGDHMIERKLDMGFTDDGNSLYIQFFHQGEEDNNPATWKAGVYQFSTDLEELKYNTVDPSPAIDGVESDDGIFSTGTSLVFVPAGQMGVESDRLQSFTPNKDNGNPNRIGIHTFGIDVNNDLQLIEDSRKDIIEVDLDTYFPTGSAFNEKHQLWVVGHTMENCEGEHGGVPEAFIESDECDPDTVLYELGPSYISIMDADFNLVQRIQVNGGEDAFRVMVKTLEDDIYVVYDEMDKDGEVETSDAKIEHYKIMSK